VVTLAFGLALLQTAKSQVRQARVGHGARGGGSVVGSCTTWLAWGRPGGVLELPVTLGFV
jgi:hypothetical protein